MSTRNMIWPDALRLLGLFLLAALLAPAPAAAYIDPLSGSIILQVLAAGVLAGALTAKRFWTRLRAFFRGVWSRIGGGL